MAPSSGARLSTKRARWRSAPCWPPGGSGIFTGRGGPLTLIAVHRARFDGFVGLSLYAEGTVAFRAFLAAGGQGIFMGNGGLLTPIAASVGRFKLLNDPALNDSGTVAFAALFAAGGQGIFKAGGGLTSIADTTGPVRRLARPQPQCLRHRCTPRWARRRAEWGILHGSEGAVTAVADTSGPFRASRGWSGSMTGARWPSPRPSAPGSSASSRGLTGPRWGHPRRACGFGSSADLLLDPARLNNACQLAFSYKRADGRTGIARADPLPA